MSLLGVCMRIPGTPSMYRHCLNPDYFRHTRLFVTFVTLETLHASKIYLLNQLHASSSATKQQVQIDSLK